MAENIALAPIRAIIHKYTGKLVNRRANALAKQKGLSAPTAVERASAKNWAKNYVRAKGGKYGGAIASLMGNDPGYGVRDVDITFGDVMGLSKASTAGLILLGPIGLIAILTGLVNTAGPAAPAPDPGTAAAAAEDDAAQAAAADDGSTDPGAGAPGGGDDGSADPGTADDGSADSSGATDGIGMRHSLRADGYAYGKNGWYKVRKGQLVQGSIWTGSKWKKLPRFLRTPSTSKGDNLGMPLPSHLSIEQLNSLSPQKRALAQKIIRTGRIRLA